MAGVCTLLVACACLHQTIGVLQPDAADVDGKTPLHWMCASDDPACAKVLTKFDKKVVNSRDNALRTALHMSVAEGKLGTVEVLLKVSTCDVNPQVFTCTGVWF